MQIITRFIATLFLPYNAFYSKRFGNLFFKGLSTVHRERAQVR